MPVVPKSEAYTRVDHDWLSQCITVHTFFTSLSIKAEFVMYVTKSFLQYTLNPRLMRFCSMVTSLCLWLTSAYLVDYIEKPHGKLHDQVWQLQNGGSLSISRSLPLVISRYGNLLPHFISSGMQSPSMHC